MEKKPETAFTTLIARSPDATGDSSVRLDVYECADTGRSVITNVLSRGRSPFTGGEVARVEPDGSRELVLAGTVLLDSTKFTPLGGCTKCSALLFVPVAEAAALADGGGHCPVCSTALADDVLARAKPLVDDDDFDVSGEILTLGDDEDEDDLDEDGDADKEDQEDTREKEDAASTGDSEPTEEEITDMSKTKLGEAFDRAALLAAAAYAQMLPAPEGETASEQSSILTATQVATAGESDPGKLFAAALESDERIATTMILADSADSSLSDALTAARDDLDGKVEEATLKVWDDLVSAFSGAQYVEAASEDDEEEDQDDDSDDVDGDDDDADDEETASDSSLPKPGERVEVDLTASLDFDHRSLSVVPVAPGVFGVYASVDGTVTSVGTFQVAKASAENAELFADASKADLLRRALVAAIEGDSDYTALGFQPIVAVIEVDSIVAERAADQAERATAEVAEQSRTAVDDFKQSVQIAAAGMNKGMFKNPLVDAIAVQLTRRGVTNAQSVASMVVTASADDYVSVLLSEADKYRSQSADARNAVATLIQNFDGSARGSDVTVPAPKQEVAQVEDEGTNVYPLRSTQSVNPALDGLFSDCGFGTAFGR